MRANQRAIHHVEAQHRQPGVVPAVLEVSIQKSIREVAPAMGDEVHREERRVAQHVDPAQRRIELDAVERRHIVAKHQGIRQVQVTMALAHLAGGLTLDPPWCQCLGLLGDPRAQRRAIRTVLFDSVECARGLRDDALRRTEPRARLDGRCGAMELGQTLGEAVDVRRVELAGRKPLGHQRAGRKAPHLQRDFDDIAAGG